MKKHRKVLLGLMALVLLVGIGAKMYANVTMGDDEWIGLGASTGRIVFDDQTPDEVNIMDAQFGIGLDNPTATLHTFGGTGVKIHRENASTDNIATVQTWTRTSTGTVVDGFGAELRFILEDDQDVTRQVGNVYVAWSDVSEDESYMSFYTRDGSIAEKMRLTHQGYLGIGDTTPSHALDVAGDIYATEEICAGIQIFSAGDIGAADDIVALDDLIAVGGVSVNDDVFTSGGNVVAQFGSVYAGTHVTATKSVYASDDVLASNDVKADGDVTADGNVTAGGDVLAGDDMHVTDDALVGGNVYATGAVTATERVLVGTAGHLAAQANMPFAAAVEDSGGFFFYTADVTADTDLTGVYSTKANIRHQAWVRWLVHDVTADTNHYGEAVLEYLDVVVIADEGANDLELKCLRGAPPNLKSHLYLDVVGNHSYEVTLLGIWQ